MMQNKRGLLGYVQLALKAVTLCALLLTQSVAIASAPKAWGYIGWWLPDSWRSAPLAKFDRLLFFELKVDAAGDISERHGWPEQWTDMRLAVEKSATPLDLALTLFDPLTFDSLFSSEEATQHFIGEAEKLANEVNVAGLQLDFEIYTLIKPDVIARYQRAVQTLATRLHKQTPARNLSVFFPIGGESEIYDAATLAHIDQVVLQGYDVHWTGSKTAGPVAPLTGEDSSTWEKSVTRGLALGVPKERLLLGFPLYGYEWQVENGTLRSTTIGKGTYTTFATLAPGLLPEMSISVQDRVRQYGASTDSVSGSSHYRFERLPGEFIEGWFEDWWSLGRKVDYLVQQQLGGIAFFMLGYDNSLLVDYFFHRRGPRNK